MQVEYAINELKSNYNDIDIWRDIRDHGCASGVASEHIYYHQTIKFFDEYEDEIIEYIADTVGGEYNEELWVNNTCNILGYKNDTVWTFIELLSQSVVDEYEEEYLP